MASPKNQAKVHTYVHMKYSKYSVCTLELVEAATAWSIQYVFKNINKTAS